MDVATEGGNEVSVAQLLGLPEKLPSRLQIGDATRFHINDTILSGVVSGVNFTASKVNYVVEVDGHYYAVDSCDTIKGLSS